MKQKRRLVLYICILFLVGWPIFQLYGMFQGHNIKQDAGKMLYQVSLFQMELLSSFLQNIDKMKDTESLNSLRQATYTANFTHTHLVLAYGDKELAELPGLSELMQYMLRLQVGGQRPLRSDEVQTLFEVRKQFAGLFDAYGRLLSSRNEIDQSQNISMTKADKAISELLRKKMQQ
jgi:hypothetical protein